MDDDKLKVIQELLDEVSEIRNLSPSTFMKSSEAQNIADDIINKLMLIRKMISQPRSPSQRLNTYAIINGDKSPTSPTTSSRKSSTLSFQKYFVTHAVINDEQNMDPRDIARTAYDSENYAKCVRVIDKILAKQDGKIDREMLHLCHDSYKKIIDDTATEKEQFKLCEWWRLFLDTVILTESCHDSQIQLIDCRTECLWERLKLSTSEDQRIRLLEQLMNQKIEAYEITAVMYRPFHINCLRRVRKICELIVEHLEQFLENKTILYCIDEGIELSRYAIDEAKVDSIEYAKETEITNQNICYIESMELIKEIERLLSEHGYSELANSDTESDCVISSEDGHEHETNKDEQQIYATNAWKCVNDTPKIKLSDDISSLTNENYITRF